MTRLPILAAAVAIAVSSTGVIATAQNTAPERPGMPQGPGAMLFERFDTNGDGSITREEIETAQAERFSAADADGDGQLSAAELAAMHETRRVERQKAGIAQMIARFDTNKDGVLSAEELATAGPRSDMFDRFDADEDGSITLSELDDARDGHRRGDGRGHGDSHSRGHGDGDGPGKGKGSWWGRGHK